MRLSTRCLVAITIIASCTMPGCGGGGGSGDIDGGGAGFVNPPTAELYPATQYVVKGSTAAFKTGISGDCDISFRWQRNGVDIPGAAGRGCAVTTAYKLPNVSELDNGARFRVIATNTAGALTSKEAVLYVINDRSRVADTGIRSNHCYRAGSDILVDCASSEAYSLNADQDGMRIEGFGFSYVGANSIEDCVMDDTSGLTWEGKVFPPDDNGATSRSLYRRTYSEAVAYANYVNSISLCGYADWRLPRLGELLSIANFGDTAHLAYWLGGYNAGYWTSTDRWVIGDGNRGGNIVPSDASTTRLNVRLVRGAPIDAVASGQRYSINAAQDQVLDTSTGLVWKRCPEGSTWSGASCTNGAMIVSHEDALAYARGSGGWRLPTIIELMSIVRTSDNPFVDSVLSMRGNGAIATYWTATPCLPLPSSTRNCDTENCEARFAFKVTIALNDAHSEFSCGAYNRQTQYQIRLVR